LAPPFNTSVHNTVVHLYVHIACESVGRFSSLVSSTPMARTAVHDTGNYSEYCQLLSYIKSSLLSIYRHNLCFLTPYYPQFIQTPMIFEILIKIKPIFTPQKNLWRPCLLHVFFSEHLLTQYKALFRLSCGSVQ
jgi:hypothetical protein